ncbi:TPA: hypothetical protein ACU6IV_003538 [Pseudomonas aeruginosa]
MKAKILTTLLLSTITLTANAEYVIKYKLEENTISFKQYYDNIGADPDGNNNTSTTPSCKVSQADLDVFGGKLLRVSDEETLKCVIDYTVPAKTFSPDCVGLTQATNVGLIFTNSMIAKGVQGISSWAYTGECS